MVGDDQVTASGSGDQWPPGGNGDHLVSADGDCDHRDGNQVTPSGDSNQFGASCDGAQFGEPPICLPAVARFRHADVLVSPSYFNLECVQHDNVLP